MRRERLSFIPELRHRIIALYRCVGIYQRFRKTHCSRGVENHEGIVDAFLPSTCVWIVWELYVLIKPVTKRWDINDCEIEIRLIELFEDSSSLWSDGAKQRFGVC